MASSRRGVTVVYDPARLTPERIADSVTRETGYRARPIETKSDIGSPAPGGAAAGPPDAP